MKISILTTDTIHHTFFVKEINKLSILTDIIVENKKIQTQSLNIHEKRRNEFELKRWFQSKDNISISTFSDPMYVENINSKKVVKRLKEFKPNIIIVFGTGMIGDEIISLFQDKLFNIHGGNPEFYRGLDSHYWSIYHNDYSNLVTTIHKVSPEFDRGDIVVKSEFKIWEKMKLHHIRSSNTEQSIMLLNLILKMKEEYDQIFSYRQVLIGRYYSNFPNNLIPKIDKRFTKFILNKI